jgi:sigma-B regulation protein RsbU (phosphoserine phosphatase)
MLQVSAIPRPVLRLIAVVFAVATIAYSAIWMYYVRLEPGASLGIEWRPDIATRMTVSKVTPGGAGDQAGLRPGDEILAINGRTVLSVAVPKALCRGKSGDLVSLRVNRPGKPGELSLRATLQPWTEEIAPTWAQSTTLRILRYFPLAFLIVGFAVLWLRLDNGNAWLLALMFSGFIAAAPIAFAADLMPPAMLRFVFSYSIALHGICPAIFYYFFATFPAASPLDRRFPWLKRWLLILAAAVSFSVALTVLITGSLRPAVRLAEVLPHQPTEALLLLYIFGTYVLGLTSLLWNNWRPSSLEDCRKTRVMVWGTVAGLAPNLLVSAAAIYLRRSYYELPFWVWTVSILAIFLLPLSFSYAVVKHRVLEIPLLLKRSARYMLVQRGFVVLILVAGAVATLVLAGWLKHYFPAHSDLGVPVGAGFGILLVFTGTQVQTRVTRRLDRAFFRSSYDARLVLEELAVNTRAASTREALAALLREQIREALHPSSLVIYLAGQNSSLVAAEAPPELRSLSAYSPFLRSLAQQGQPWEVPLGAQIDGLSILRPLQPECLVPILARSGQMLGLIVLGSRLSEEPYSREDRRLLASVAGQAGVSTENIKLAEAMAERMEAERRTAQELEIAREVQAKLLPQRPPVLATLDYAGKCQQARAVGGDYYDFLDLGSGQMGFVLADIVGKGISAALLMANLQAYLRSLSAVLAQDPAKFLQSINRMFYESTEPNKFVTLFVGIYDDTTRRLRYANCGHHPPLLLREHSVDHLTSTTTVLGLFEPWECPLAETQLYPGDLLAIYTDGVVEAENGGQEQFGEARLLETLQANRSLSPRAVLDALLAAVESFASGEQADDLTLVIGRAQV